MLPYGLPNLLIFLLYIGHYAIHYYPFVNSLVIKSSKGFPEYNSFIERMILSTFF
nr:MAG TPA: hypothetical protein [Caudoviricetes sp.]